MTTDLPAPAAPPRLANPLNPLNPLAARWSASRPERRILAIAAALAWSDLPNQPYTTDVLCDHLTGLMDALGIGAAHLSGESLGGSSAAPRPAGRWCGLATSRSRSGSPAWASAPLSR